MLTMRQIHSHSNDWERVQTLYQRAFPEDERSPLELLDQDPSGISEIMAFYEGNSFCGFACILVACGLSHIIYIAIEETARGMGYGSQALRLIQEKYPQNRIVVDMEEILPQAPNRLQREKRQQFYLHNGYCFCPIAYEWRGEKYQILSDGELVSEKEFWDFWEYVIEQNHSLAQF